MEDIKHLNLKLERKYGRSIDQDKPRFRIVWSSSQYEKRYGEYEIFSEGGIFLREEKGVSLEPKYLPEFPDMWVLEEFRPTVGNPYLERVTNFSYEPVWIFGAANSDRKPNWRAVDLLVRNRLHGDPNRKVKSPSDLVREEEERMEKERERTREMLRDNTPALAFSLKHGSAIVVPEIKNV